ncbi:hypothetical protein GGX14DRAFT_601033 [Mycena pura]|uniref:F-box domain-containing protein n=1 Tax=Mycena pura TaxID=153505 RepID=A0AAD6UQ41_9AGAR|nr:hypothetical protein GGX14DRAFT_601033 [Mycena pura]
MPQSLQFLDLPPELILACLVHLPFNDLTTCLNAGNRLLHDILADSVLMRYRAEQEYAGIEENLHVLSNLVISDRLKELRRREEDWLDFSPRARHTITLDFRTTGLYDLAADIYMVGDTPDPATSLCTAIKYVYTSPGPDTAQWHCINAGRPIVDFGTALEEHDLIAIVTYAPVAAHSQVYSVDVQLLRFSTGSPHPLATRPNLHIHVVSADCGSPGVSLAIVGRTLAIAFIYWGAASRDLDTLHLYDWQLGLPIVAAFEISNTALGFLTPDIIIIPNSLRATLDVFRIPPLGSKPAAQLEMWSFCLPTLQSGHTILSFRCRGEPNPRTSLVHAGRARFLPKPEDAIMLFSFETGGLDEHCFVLHRASFLRFLHAAAVASPPLFDETAAAPWSTWGPQCTSWIDGAPLSQHYITTTAGQRMVGIRYDAPERAAPVVVFDFTARALRICRRRAEAPEAAEGPGDHAAPAHARAVVRVVEHPPSGVQPAPAAAFAEPVVSLLPYVEIVSEETFDFGAVIINNENIIGVRFSGEDSVQSLEILHFG